MKKMSAEWYANRAAKRLQQRVAIAVAKLLGVTVQKTILFPAVAARMGRPWTPGAMGKKIGYALVMEFAEQQGIKPAPLARGIIKRANAKRANVASNEFLESYAWRRLRMEVIKKRGTRCECCGATSKDGVTVINVDHIKPRKLFPELALEESNLQVLCHECNHGKGNWDQTDWREPEPEGPVH